MNKTGAWLIHAGLAILGALVATGAIFDPSIVPPHLQRYVLELLPVLFYLGGVRMPTPGSAGVPIPSFAGASFQSPSGATRGSTGMDSRVKPANDGKEIVDEKNRTIDLN